MLALELKNSLSEWWFNLIRAVAKKKLARFAEILEFGNVIQAGADEVLNRKHPLWGKWKNDFFNNDNPIILELGCGKGEYTTGLALMSPDKNFIGVDIKGARLWKGARFAYENRMPNVGFIRTRIEMISSFFSKDEVDQIWLTFPDPQPKKAKKRLTSPSFLNRYRKFMSDHGFVHLKTDSRELYDYTLEVIDFNGLELIESTSDLYDSCYNGEIVSIKTYYESLFLNQGKPICYAKFKIDKPAEIIEPDVQDRRST